MSQLDNIQNRLRYINHTFNLISKLTTDPNEKLYCKRVAAPYLKLIISNKETPKALTLGALTLEGVEKIVLERNIASFSTFKGVTSFLVDSEVIIIEQIEV